MRTHVSSHFYEAAEVAGSEAGLMGEGTKAPENILQAGSTLYVSADLRLEINGIQPDPIINLACFLVGE